MEKLFGYLFDWIMMVCLTLSSTNERELMTAARMQNVEYQAAT